MPDRSYSPYLNSRLVTRKQQSDQIEEYNQGWPSKQESERRAYRKIERKRALDIYKSYGLIFEDRGE